MNKKKERGLERMNGDIERRMEIMKEKLRIKSPGNGSGTSQRHSILGI